VAFELVVRVDGEIEGVVQAEAGEKSQADGARTVVLMGVV